MRPKTQRAGFTLIELVVVIAIIVALMALILPAVMKAREAASRMLCASNLRNIGMGLQGYVSDYTTYPTGGGDVFHPFSVSWDNDNSPHGYRPMPRVKSFLTPGVGKGGSITEAGVPNRREYQDWGWAYQILPYIDQANLWGLPNTEDMRIGATPIPLYFCPSRGGSRVVRHAPGTLYQGFETRACIDYAGNGGPFGFTDLRDVKDLRPWVPKTDAPIIGHSDQPNNTPSPAIGWYHMGIFVKNRCWTKWPVPAWFRNFYVDPLLRPSQVVDGVSNTLLIGEKRIDRQRLGQPHPGDRFGWTSGFSNDTIRTGSYWVPYPTCSGSNSGMGQLYFFNGPISDSVRHENWCDRLSPVGFEGFGSAHVSGMNALFADGSVRGIRHDTGGGTQRVRVWHTMIDYTRAERPRLEFKVFQLLLHRADHGRVAAAEFEE